MASKKPKKAKNTRGARSKALAAQTNTILKVLLPTAEPINARVDFFASQLKNVCRTSPKKAACFRRKDDGSRGGRYNAAQLGLEKGATPDEIKNACSEVEGEFVGAGTKPIRPGKVELDFLSKAQAAQLNTLPGPNLRLCRVDDEKGVLVPVADPSHAKYLKQRFDRCVRGDKSKMPSCALQVATRAWRGSAPPLGFVSGGSLTGGLFSR